MSNLLKDNAELMKEYNYAKNADLDLSTITLGTHKKIWWICSIGHEWSSEVCSRNKGVGCPYCANYKAWPGYNDLASLNPQLASEWDYAKNGDLKPTDVTTGSHKRVWWKCKKGHEWERSVKDRSAGNGCPYCSNIKVLPGYNDLATINPKLAKEWNYEKNGELKPENVIAGSEKKVWWKCPKGHEWQAIIYNRNKGVGCPICDSKVAFAGYNDLATTNPDLAEEWNYEKNGDLKPNAVTSGSHKNVWWKCKNGHEWEADIKSRNEGNGCPYCSNKKVLQGYNDLATIYPEIAAEWSSKNTVQPSNVIRGGDKKYYWICPLGHKDYLSSVGQRLQGQGCPVCARQSQTSFPEQAIYFYVKQLFPDAINRYVIDKSEIDIYIPSRSIGIEYNGYFSHKDKARKDLIKREKLSNRSIELVTIKEYKKEEECQDADFYIQERTTYDRLTRLIILILSRLKPNNDIDVDCAKDQTQIKEQYIDSLKKKSIAVAMPTIIDEWDAEKNGNIKPEFVGRNSTLKYFWKCRNCGFSYLAAPSHRLRGTGCPSCCGKAVHPGFNDLISKNPDIASEWDKERNGDLDPSTVFYHATIEVWWKCKEGHSWKKSVYSRTYNKSKCPYCTGRCVITGYNDLLTKRPDLAEEWDYDLNNTAPDKVHFNNQTIQAHWICKKCGYKWVHTVSQRDRCPECLRRRTQINVYNAEDYSLYGHFVNARDMCEHLGLDYNRKHQSISNACRRKDELFLGKYILRHPIDDEFSKNE